MKPQPGDIVVERRPRPNGRSTVRYALRIEGGPAQYLEGTYEWALNRADTFARTQTVDVWYTDDGLAFRRVTRRRPARARTIGR